VYGESDERGEFLLLDLPEGKIELMAFAPGYDLKKINALLVQQDQENFIEVSLREGAPLSGIVIDGLEKTAVSGAEVEYVIGKRIGEEIRVIYQEQAVTDGEGLFHFEKVSRRGYRLQVNAQGYSTKISQPFDKIDDPSALMKILLDRESALSGIVYDPDGNPAPGAEVKVFERGLWDRKERRTRTDGTGAFRLEPVAPGELRIFASHRAHAPALSDAILLSAGDVLENVEIFLERGSSLQGEVKDPDETPVEGARVVLEGIKPRLIRDFQIHPVTLTNAQGMFAFDNLSSGDYRIAASSLDLRSGTEEISLFEGEDFFIELILENGLQVSGSVYDSFGSPLDDVLITSFAADPVWIEKITGKKKQDSRKRPQSGKSPGSKEASKNTGVRDLFETGLLKSLQLTHYRGCTRSDENGRFLLHGFLPEDSIVLGMRKHGYNKRMIRDILPGAENLEITLHPLAQIHGRVVDASTLEPIPAFTVIVKDLKKKPSPRESGKNRMPDRSSGERRYFFRSEDGTFLVDSLKPSEFDVFASARRYQRCDPERIHVAPGSPVTYVDLLLDLSGTLKGRVLGSNKTPVSGISVFLKPLEGKPTPWEKKGSNKKKKSSKGGKGKKTPPKKPATSRGDPGILQSRTRADGRFIFKDLKPRSYEVLIGDAMNPTAKPKSVNVVRGKTTTSAFLLKDLGFVEIKIRDESGFSLRADLSIAGGPAKLYCKKSTDDLGNAKFINLVPGKYKLVVECPKFRSYKKTLTIKKDKNPSLEIELKKKHK
jgi:protocatechuate 3,4-dioxygenase beta subunit